MHSHAGAWERGRVGARERLSLVPMLSGSLAPARESVLTLYVIMLPYAFPRGSVGTRTRGSVGASLSGSHAPAWESVLTLGVVMLPVSYTHLRAHETDSY